jgi:hypothetical protein
LFCNDEKLKSIRREASPPTAPTLQALKRDSKKNEQVKKYVEQKKICKKYHVVEILKNCLKNKFIEIMMPEDIRNE